MEARKLSYTVTTVKIAPRLIDETPVKLKTMGNIQEISFVRYMNASCPIRLLDKDFYLDKRTGEVLACRHIENRSQSLGQVAQSLKRLRELINSNVVNVAEWKWITLTYADNMTDSKRLYLDFKNFMKRFKYHFSKYKIDYIIACEPQARGAWHVHALIGFNETAPFIPNDEIAKLWSHGFTKTNKLDGIDNVGAYLTAYLGDIELNKVNVSSLKEKGCNLTKNALEHKIEVKTINDTKYIKGGRLYMYPPNFNLYRFSRSCKKPLIEKLEYFDAKIKVGVQKPTFKVCKEFYDSNTGFRNTYYYEQYNILRKE